MTLLPHITPLYIELINHSNCIALRHNQSKKEVPLVVGSPGGTVGRDNLMIFANIN